MKKLSLMLAFVLVFALVLVACGDETETSSTPATESSVAATESSEAATESSEAATESSVAATESTEESTEASTEESTEVSTEAPEAGTENLAAGKTYTVSQLFRQGGREAGWGWDANVAITYPDEDGKTMTDGVIAADDAAYDDAVWAGWSNGAPDYKELGYAWITVDLGEAKDLAKAVIHLGSSGLGQGIGAGNMVVEVAVSTDGTTFETVGGVVPEDDAASCTIETVINFEAVANARYVQFRMVRSGWMFVSEVEVYGVAE